MIKQTESVDQIRIFEYSLLNRLHLLLILGMMMIMYLIIIADVLLSLFRMITGQMIAERIGGPSDPGTLLVEIFVPLFILFGGLTVGLMYPAVHIKPDGFRISRYFYTSPWFDWQDIHIIKKPSSVSWRRGIFGMTVQGLPHRYFSFTGAYVLSESKNGFMVTNKIGHYKELVHFFQYHRPDLFEGPGKVIIEELDGL